jgi:hypothetical protein
VVSYTGLCLLFLLSLCGVCSVVLSLRGLFGGGFPSNAPMPPSSHMKQNHAHTRPHCHPLPLGKPSSTLTVHWFASCIARWKEQGRARRGNAQYVSLRDVLFCEVKSKPRQGQNLVARRVLTRNPLIYKQIKTAFMGKIFNIINELYK